MDKGSDPRSVDRLGYSLAYSIQEELLNFRGSENKREYLQSVKERLEKEYGIQFPVENQRRKGMENEIANYERLPKEIKELPGMEDDLEYIQEVKDSLAAGKTITGQPLKN